MHQREPQLPAIGGDRRHGIHRGDALQRRHDAVIKGLLHVIGGRL